MGAYEKLHLLKFQTSQFFAVVPLASPTKSVRRIVIAVLNTSHVRIVIARKSMSCARIINKVTFILNSRLLITDPSVACVMSEKIGTRSDLSVARALCLGGSNSKHKERGAKLTEPTKLKPLFAFGFSPIPRPHHWSNTH